MAFLTDAQKRLVKYMDMVDFPIPSYYYHFQKKTHKIGTQVNKTWNDVFNDSGRMVGTNGIKNWSDVFKKFKANGGI